MSPDDSFEVTMGRLLAYVLLPKFVCDGDLATTDAGYGLPGLREITRLVPGPDGIPLLVVER